MCTVACPSYSSFSIKCKTDCSSFSARDFCQYRILWAVKSKSLKSARHLQVLWCSCYDSGAIFWHFPSCCCSCIPPPRHTHPHPQNTQSRSQVLYQINHTLVVKLSYAWLADFTLKHTAVSSLLTTPKLDLCYGFVKTISALQPVKQPLLSMQLSMLKAQIPAGAPDMALLLSGGGTEGPWGHISGGGGVTHLWLNLTLRVTFSGVC